MTRVVSLGMYDFPWLVDATDTLWANLRASLRAAGMADVPEALDRSRPLRAILRDPALLLGQTCGYPLLTEFSDALRVIAAPAYSFPGCDGVLHRSFVVVRADELAPSVAAMRGRRCAINGRDSNTGMNLLRALLAPLADGRPFFGVVIETGAHLDSLSAVRAGHADLTAIDCVTYGLIAQRQPALLRGTRILAKTAATPGLPFVTAVGTSAADLAALRSALVETAGSSAAAALGWSGIEILDVAAYAPLAALERNAAAAGYRVLA